MDMRPAKIAIYIWITIALLGAVCWLVPKDGWKIGEYTLRWPTLAEVLEIDDATPDSININMSDSLLLAQIELSDDSIPSTTNETSTEVKNDSTSSSNTTNVPKETAVHTVTDTRDYLFAFYQALDSTHEKAIRVIHYGDSQIEEDRITNILREHWQNTYGGGGAGLLPLHQTIPTRTIRQTLSFNGNIQTTQGGPKRYLIYGPRNMRQESNLYGVMGQVAIMDNDLVAGSEEMVMRIDPYDNSNKKHHSFNQLRLLSDNISGTIHTKDSIISIHANEITTLPNNITRCEIHLQGKGAVYGVSLETDKGVIVDNIPMRGCSGNIFTRIDSAQLSSFYQSTNTRLIILQFGGNMIPQTENTSTINGYVKTLRQQIRYLRTCAPQASILFIGPSDMSTRIDGEMTTYPLIPYLDKLLALMAEQEKIAYWSIYNAMGGYNSMVRWQESGLAGSDYVHFTRAGANKVGKMIVEWFDGGKD